MRRAACCCRSRRREAIVRSAPTRWRLLALLYTPIDGDERAMTGVKYTATKRNATRSRRSVGRSVRPSVRLGTRPYETQVADRRATRVPTAGERAIGTPVRQPVSSSAASASVSLMDGQSFRIPMTSAADADRRRSRPAPWVYHRHPFDPLRRPSPRKRCGDVHGRRSIRASPPPAVS